MVRTEEKIIKPRVIKESKKTYYVCEYCGSKFVTEKEANRCEVKCTCKHPNKWYGLNEDSYGSYYGIYIDCKNCGKRIGYIDFESIDSEYLEDQETLKKIFEVVKSEIN